MNDQICPRCLSGKDNDNDGNCPVCSKWSDERAREQRDWVKSAAAKNVTS